MIAARDWDAKNRRQRVSGSAMFVSTGTALATSGTNVWIASFRSLPRPAKASPKPRRLSRWPARVGRSHMPKKSSNSTGVAVWFSIGIVPPSGKPLLRVAARDLDVLQPQRRPWANHDRGVHRQRLDPGLELQVQLRHHGPVVLLDGGDLVHHAHAQPADPGLVALHQAGRDRHLGREAVGRHPGQARVRVVGEEDRHHDHERGRHAHEDGVRSDRCRAAAPAHWPSPKQVVDNGVRLALRLRGRPASPALAAGAQPSAAVPAPRRRRSPFAAAPAARPCAPAGGDTGASPCRGSRPPGCGRAACWPSA